MAVYLRTAGFLILDGDGDEERNLLIAALDAAVDASYGSRSITRATVDKWRELRKALAS